MRDNVTCEEVFELHADSWVAGVTVPNGFDNVEDEADDGCWCKFFESCSECGLVFSLTSNGRRGRRDRLDVFL